MHLLPVLVLAVLNVQEDDEPSKQVYPAIPEGRPPVLVVENATASVEAEMQAYTDRIVGTDVTFDMVPIPSGTFQLGSPSGEDGREKSEGPQRMVEVSTFWMGKHEVTWDEYHLFMLRIDQELRLKGEVPPAEQDAWADAISRPTPPYVPMDFNMGVDGHPAICMTQFAAKQYCKWLSMKTGRFYRLPTEAEGEFACRAGT
ncbi:MAG: formylglycine-generating enzyme family protein, partial [Planctomycetota bacterium]|nr:formylglycine-generating enzyme family protein [Planctomycetota bacterium]